MVKAVPDILAQIVERKRQEIGPVTDVLLAQAERMANERRGFANALRGAVPAIIAEIKKASPSKGVLAPDFDPTGTAAAYERGGARALSVLTDREFFHGELLDLEQARAAVRLPVLRKDFTIAEWQIMEAAAHGADAILLIASILSARELRDFREAAERYRMDALVEIHDADELDAAVDSGARIIGVNNRDLRTFQVSLDTALRLADRIPAEVIRVAESGISSREDIRRLQAAGYQAFLVGEHLMKSGHPEESLRALLG